jgi:hypothetical protein
MDSRSTELERAWARPVLEELLSTLRTTHAVPPRRRLANTYVCTPTTRRSWSASAAAGQAATHPQKPLAYSARRRTCPAVRPARHNVSFVLCALAHGRRTAVDRRLASSARHENPRKTTPPALSVLSCSLLEQVCSSCPAPGPGRDPMYFLYCTVL